MAHSKQVLALASLNVGNRRPVGPNQSRINQNFTAVGQAWTALSPTARAAWQLLANQMNHDTGLRTPAGLKQKRPMSAFQCFGSVNGILLASGLPLNPVAPAAPIKPDALPPLMLTAQATTGVQDDATTPGFILTVTTPGYSDTLQIYACPPLLVGQYPSLGPKAAIIHTIHGTSPGPIDLAADYQAKFGPLAPGQQVVLSLVPVSHAGFKGSPLTLAADVQAPTALAAKRTINTSALKAA